VRELERRQISQPSPDSSPAHGYNDGGSSVRSREKRSQATAGAVAPSEVSAERRVAEGERGGKAVRANSHTTDQGGGGGGRGGGGRGYLKQHLEDEEEDRRIMELEREVANLETMGLGSSGKAGKLHEAERPRAASATPAQRRSGVSKDKDSSRTPRSARGGGAGEGTPSSVSSTRRAASAGRPSRPTKKLSNAQQVSE
jgi:hypothetical protein